MTFDRKRANAYNFRTAPTGRRSAAFTEAVAVAQEKLGLLVDGKLGPITEHQLLALSRPPAPSRQLELALSPRSLGVRAVELAEKEIGRGEDPELGNNRGGAVDEYRRIAGLQEGDDESWCAELGSAMLVKARLPGDRDFETSAGAKKLGHNLIAAGWRELGEDENPQRGDVIIWDRGDGAPENEWMGHFGLIAGYLAGGDILETVEGNKGPTVQPFTYEGTWRHRKWKVLRAP